jgi:hypothetical protein
MFSEKQLLEILQQQGHSVNHLISIVDRLSHEHEHHHHKHQNVKLVLQTAINNNFKITFMALQLTDGFFSLDQLALIDTDTNTQVAATFANVQPFVNDNPSILTTAPDPGGDPTKAKNTAIGAGVANVSTTADATYTDSVSKQPVTKTLKLSIPYTCVAVVAGENVALTLIQGTPTAVTS